MDPDFGEFPAFFMIAFILAGLFIVAVGAVVVTGVVRSRKVLRANGMDPMTAHAELAARLAHGPLGTPAKSREQRLAELDDLHRRGLITADEHAEARRAALAE
jgi:hypothetical protein